MSAAIKSTYGVDPELIEGRGGVFEICADGDLIFSKKALGRFPESEDEVMGLLKSQA